MGMYIRKNLFKNSNIFFINASKTKVEQEKFIKKFYSLQYKQKLLKSMKNSLFQIITKYPVNCIEWFDLHIKNCFKIQNMIYSYKHDLI